MQSHDKPSTMDAALTETLLRCGIAAGPLYILVGLGQILTREGFDMRRHPLSLLSNGELGWIQIANFLLPEPSCSRAPSGCADSCAPGVVARGDRSSCAGGPLG